MSKFKILIFNWRCWLNPAMGGAEVFTKEIAKRWAEHGHEVTLFTSEYPGCLKEEVSEGITIVRAGGRLSVYLNARKLYSSRFAKENFDVVIDEINTVPFLSPNFVKHGEKVVALIHQLAREYWFYELPFPISYAGYYFLEDRWLRNYVDLPTVTVSESTKQDLLSLGFAGVSVVPEGLNFEPLEAIQEKEDFPVIVYAGRLKRAKRPDHAVRAFKTIREKVPKAELWVMGNGPFRKDLEKMAGDGVHFFGSLNDVERRARISRSWILVNPSVREGWGLNIVEANALGVPSVAYDVPGLRDSVLNGQTGMLVKSGDIQALTEGILNVLKDKNLRERLSENALIFSRNFCWDKAASEFMNVIENVFRK